MPAPQPEGMPSAPAAPAIVPQGCKSCGAPMDAAQDWCFHCGAGAPDSLSARSPSWRSAAAVLGAIAVLVAGAATAAYAALSKSASKPRVTTATVAQAPAPAAPTATTPGSLPPSTAKIGTPTTVKPLIPLAKPPKIPLVAAVPKPSTPPATIPSLLPTTSTPSTTTPKTTGAGGSSATKEPQPESILLDTNAAATYNPNGYPASTFGDPSLAIDGDTSTAWTALVDPAIAPKMADGLVIDLKSAQKLSTLLLNTSTPGMTVQVYGANAAALPTTITDPAWVKLSGLVLEKKKSVRIPLRDSAKAFRFVTLWITRVPAASVGSAEAPGHVSVNELELFPTRK